MRAKGVGEYTRAPPVKTRSLRQSNSANSMVRLQPQTYQQLAALRRPLVDPEGNLVALESFDRLVRRLLGERRADGASPELPREVRP
jgi:hypothetical protein